MTKSPSTPAERQARSDRILELRDAGFTYKAIGDRIGVSASRVRQIHMTALRLSRDGPTIALGQLSPESPTGLLPLSRRARATLLKSPWPRLGDLLAIDRAELLPLYLALPHGNRRTWDELAQLLNVVAERQAKV